MTDNPIYKENHERQLMSESKVAIYEFDGSVHCPNCGICLGQYVTEGKEKWIQTAMIRAYAIHGKCASCGKEYHFTASHKRLEALVSKITKPVV